MPSSPSGNKDATEQFEETELFDDTLALNSPFTELQVEDLNLNTEIVEDSEPTENMASDPICEYGHEVVLDSEDEEMDNGEAVTAVKGLLDDRTSPTIRMPSMRKRRVKAPYEQADPNGTSLRKAATGLNHIHSPELGYTTEAALGFVDRYLSSDNVELFQGIQNRKTIREKSRHVLSAGGSLSLVRKIKSRFQKGDETFRLVDSDQNDKGVGIFGKETDTSSNFGSYRQTYTRTRQKEGGDLQNQGMCSTGNRCDENLVQEPEMVTEYNNSFKELNVQSSVTRETVNAYSCVTHSEDMFDIGLDTQIAAEAMEALAFVPPTGCHFDDTHQPENACDCSLSDLTENEAHLKNSMHRQNSDLQSITTKSNRNVYSVGFSRVTSSSSSKHTESPEPNPVSEKMQNVMKSKPTFKAQVEKNTSSPIHSEHVSLEEVCTTGEYVSFQPAAKETKNWNRSRRTRIKDQPSHHSKTNKNVEEEEGTIRHKRKLADLAADPLKLSIRAKRLKLPTGSCVVSRKNRLNHQVQFSPQLSATSCLLRNDSWVYPRKARGKRKRANVQNNLDAPTIFCIDAKESNVYPTRSLGGQDDVDKSCFPHTLPLAKASRDDNRCLLMGMMPEAQPGSADDAMKFENPHDAHPLLLAHVDVSNKCAAQSSPEIPATISSSKGMKTSNANHKYNEHHKMPWDKNMPKSSLLKELISLGVSEPTSNLRQRRDMTFVRVLFSQHLDDSVVKQQKKILARLNVSIASSSMEATHFIADKFTRTKNMLETMALGKLVVTHLWLESCKEANCFIDEKSYILRDVKKEKEIGFSMPVSLARARQNPLLKGKRVYITPNIKPKVEVIANLVAAVHGQVVDESQLCAHKDDKIIDGLLILSCEEDYTICQHFLKRGATVYSSELLLNGIVIQKLELERHQLFKDQATRNIPSTFNRFGKVYRRRSRPVAAP